MSSNRAPAIGIVSWDFDPPKGGMGRSLQWIVEAVKDGGFDVVVGSMGSLIPRIFQSGGHLLFSLLLPFFLHRWIDRNHISHLLIPTGPGGIFLFFKPRNVRIVCLACHTYEQQARLVPGQWWKKIFLPLERRTLRMTDHVLCFSEDTKNAVRTYAIDQERITQIPHAIDTSVKHIDKQQGLCLCIARLEARKGIDVLLAAWPHIVRSHPEAKLMIIGKGIEASRIDRRIASIGSSASRIASLPREELLQLIAEAEVLICPSYLEGFGLAVAEAMMNGTAVVATNTEGIRNLIIDQQTGMLFPAEDAKALADAVISLLEDRSLRDTITQAAIKRTKDFDPTSANVALVNVMRRIIANA